MTFRTAVATDFDAVTRIRIDAIMANAPEHHSTERARAWAYREDFPDRCRRAIEAGLVVLLEDSSTIVGWVAFKDDFISGIYVVPERWSRGHGARLMRFAEDRIGEKGTDVRLKAATPSISFYEARGYLRDGKPEPGRGTPMLLKLPRPQVQPCPPPQRDAIVSLPHTGATGDPDRTMTMTTLRTTLLSVALLALLLILPLPVSADTGARPEGEGATKIHAFIFVVDVDEVDSASQSFDANVFFSLVWNDPREARELDHARTVPLDSVWNPRVLLVNQQMIWKSMPEVVEIAPNGDITYRQRVWGSFSQPLDLRDFPMDNQSFEILLASVAYRPHEIEFVTHARSAQWGLAESLSLADWSVLNWNSGPRLYEPIKGAVANPGFALQFEAKRQTRYYLLKVVLPLILIVIMSWIVFWIDPQESGTQISVAVTSILTLIAYRFMVDSLLPKVSYLTRLDIFVMCSTLLVFSALIEAVLTANLVQKGHKHRALSLDRIARVVYPLGFIGVLYISFW